MTPYHAAIETAKREVVTRALTASRGCRTDAARALGVQRTKLVRWIRDLAIDVPPDDAMLFEKRRDGGRAASRAKS